MVELRLAITRPDQTGTDAANRSNMPEFVCGLSCETFEAKEIES